ncbi:MAG: substrate-binding domain-containing protein [Desulfobacteraceae bacterium]|nr:substrate-binding domain-containing protein [Desulfobacteraceae bacterium]
MKFFIKLRIIRYCIIFFLLFSTILPCLTAQTTNDFNAIVKSKGQVAQGNIQVQPVKIAFATPLKQVSDYWRRSIDSFKGRMDEIGLDYEIKEFSTKVDETRKLKECVQSALQIEPDYLVVTPNDPGDKTIISRMLGRGDIKVIVQNVTTANNDWKENPPFMYVGFNHTIGAGLIAEEYIKRYKGKTNIKYAMLYHVYGNQVSQLRGDFFNEIIRNRTDFKLIAENYTGGNRENAKDAALKIIKQHPDINFIHACSTDITFGILDALKDLNLVDQILVNGWGGGANELKSLIAGDLNFTVMRMNDDNGVAMAEAIRLDIESKLEAIPLIYSGEMVIVNKGIIEDDIITLKKKAFRYSGWQ